MQMRRVSESSEKLIEVWRTIQDVGLVNCIDRFILYR